MFANAKVFQSIMKKEMAELTAHRYINKNIAYFCYKCGNRIFIEVCVRNTEGYFETKEIYYPSEYIFDIFCKEPVDNHDLYVLRKNYKNLLKGNDYYVK